jgi:1-deoxy-D-xylulose-5-phosphate reductoisomerase
LNKLTILGSSGSIGQNALWVANRFPGELKIFGLSVHSNTATLTEQIKHFRPQVVCVVDRVAASAFTIDARALGVEFLSGEEGLETLAAHPDADIVLNSVVGFAGLRSTLAAARVGKRVALANKESMVAGGELVNKTVRDGNAEIIPVDSEHSAIFQ